MDIDLRALVAVVAVGLMVAQAFGVTWKALNGWMGLALMALLLLF